MAFDASDLDTLHSVVTLVLIVVSIAMLIGSLIVRRGEYTILLVAALWGCYFLLPWLASSM
jgi:hypothetical protein